MYFFVIDSDMTSKNRTFVDYCGAWNRPSLKHLRYLSTNTDTFEYIHINKINSKKKGSLALLDNQPDVNSVIFSRYHLKHRSDNNYQRRVIWFQNVPKRNDLHMMCLIEYISNYTGEQTHGNSKRTNQPYIRTSLWLKSLLF